MSGHIPLSANLDWNTPHWVRDRVLETFQGKLDLDPCSNPTSIMGADLQYQLPANDGLHDPWSVRGSGTTAYLNPPFGRAYMTPDRSSILGAKEFQALPPDQRSRYSVHTSIGDWVAKAVVEATQNSVESILLLPAATDTQTWQASVWRYATSLCFIKGRIRFLMANGQPGGPCPMAMALVYLGRHPSHFMKAFEDRGHVLNLSWSIATSEEPRRQLVTG